MTNDEARSSWDAAAYHHLDTPMARWAEVLLDELRLSGDEVVLDAGCGSGIVTESLARRLPRGRVHALDASVEMLTQLREHAAARGLANVHPLHGDLTTTAPVEPCDVLFSNAVFHWIEDFDAVSRALRRWARPGARLRAQCGGVGNLARIHEAASVAARSASLAGHVVPAEPHVWFRTPDEARASLEGAGFTNVEAWLQVEPTPLGARAATTRYLGAIILRLQVQALPTDALRAAYLDATYDTFVARHGEPFVADYVRLNLRALAPG